MTTKRIIGDALVIPNWHVICRWGLRVLFVIAFGCSAGTTLAGLYFLHSFMPTPAPADTVAKLKAENDSLRITIADYVAKLNGKPGRAGGVGGP